MTRAITKMDPAATAKRILDALAGGLTEAARIYREYVEHGGDVMALRAEARISTAAWRHLDAVALGRVDPRVFLAANASTASALAALPVHMQQQVCDEGVEVLSVDGTALRVNVADLTVEQARMVFGMGAVRDLAAQRAYLESERVTRATTATRALAQLEYDDKRRCIRVWPGTANEVSIPYRDALRHIAEADRSV